MTRHTLFLFHGMGRHEGEQWSNEIWNKLVECSERYKHFQTKKKLEEYAEPFPIGYDQFISKTLTRWDSEATTFEKFVKLNNADEKVDLGWLSGVSAEDDNFKSSHLADVIICRFFPLEYGQIKSNVQLKVFNEIHQKRKLDVDAKFSVMAHSLGTAVAHDALAELGAAPEIDGNVNTFNVQNFKFESIHMLANVSRLLQTKPKAYESIMRPGPNNSKTRYCSRMYCYQHELDPISLPKKFDPVTWGNRFDLRRVDHYRGWNVHGWLHYLDNPRVHIPLLKSLTKSSTVSSNQERDMVDQYPRYGGELENLNQAQTKIAELHALAQSIDQDGEIGDNFKSLSQLWAGINELKEIAGDTWSTLVGSIE